MRKRYEMQIPIKVCYSNIPTHQVNQDELPQSLQVTIKEQGFYLLLYRIKETQPICFDMNEMETDKHYLYIGEEKTKTVVKNVLLQSTEIIKIHPERISVKKIRKDKKKVEVLFDGNINFAEQYSFSDKLRIEPESIMIYGEKTRLNNIQFVKTRKKHFSNIKDTIIQTLEIQQQKGIDFHPKQVKIEIPVDKFTEKKLEIPITVKNIPENLTLKTFPANVEVRFFVTFSKFNAVSKNDIAAFVDFNETTNNKLKVNIESYKPFIFNLRTNVKEVEYLIEKK